ncbi:putative O-glycosylation ligase, exosortase A system-associated [Parasphingopyxis sp. CP4]|uniref:putative O-glycosylation ligase, exosortase A system-associated n=1 Tax=Parasphingopyxis sp. CP4 TaxID=2724527 RepID=UPI0015A25031|nr:putative O-glycosylation ligase, exosortase A system-associated [Parasphingopyxis sp. CP4]QLC20962.1 putative O-glycosylation ligase, exosortase A system-associated [Parasphingopyxis sp. CP4]
MTDLAFAGFVAALLILGLRQPFLWVLAYAYVDVVSPHELSYRLLSDIPLSMIVAPLAIGGWFVFDKNKSFQTSPSQWLIAMFGLWCGFTTLYAEFPVEAEFKWDWVWKGMLWALFVPFALRNRVRIESYILFMVLGAATIMIAGAIKTLLSGGGYGTLNMMVDSNSGIYESSTASTIAITIIPLILWLARHGTIFPKDWRVTTFATCLIFACLLIPIGTEARTGLVCIAVLGILILRDNQRRFMFIGLAGFGAIISLPFLPQSFSDRMGTISTYQADFSAMTRIAVWRWTLEYVSENPAGGGFGIYHGNNISYETSERIESAGSTSIQRRVVVDRGRAYHSAYFEVLAEQGWLGLGLWLTIHGLGVLRMEMLRRRYRGSRAPPGYEWVSPLATALQHAQLIYLVGALFIAIAFQSFILMLLAVQISLDLHMSRVRKQSLAKPLRETLREPGIAKLSPVLRSGS